MAGGIWKLGASVLPQVYVVILSLVAARVLQPSGMGRQSYISFVYLTTTLLVTGGYSASLMRSVAELAGRRRSDLAGGLVAWTRRRQAVAGALGAGLLAAATMPGSDLSAAWAFASLAMFFAVLQSVPHAALTGLQRWRAVASISLVLGAATTVATVTVLLAGGGIVGMFAVEAVAAAISFLAFTITLRRHLPRAATPVTDADLLRKVKRYAHGEWLHLVLHVIVWRRAELLILERTAVAEEIAHYSVAFALLTAVAQVPSAFATTLTPAFATLAGEDALARIATGFARAVRLLGSVTIPLAILLTVLAPRAIAVVYGPEYARAGEIATLLALSLPFTQIHAVSAALVQGLGSIRPVLIGNGVATVVDLALALWLIPRYGALGAAGANLAAQFTAAALLYGHARTTTDTTIRLRTMLAPTVWAFIAAGVAWGTLTSIGGATGLVAASVGAGVTFMALVAAFGLVGEQDARWVVGAVGPNVPSLARRWLPLLGRRRLLIRPD